MTQAHKSSANDIHTWRARVERTSACETVEAVIERIEAENPVLNAFSVVMADEARQQARELDALPADQRGPLHGVPFVVKDEIDVAGYPTTFGTHANVRIKKADSEIVARLRAAGAIPVAKTRMPEFGAWPQTFSDHAGATRNPHDLARTPGGSSGGTAAAVASGIVPFGLGGDGGGSIRIPSAHCGLVGLKPQRGKVPTKPYRNLWLTLGTPGALTTTAEDAALVYDVIADGSAHLVRALEHTGPLRVRWTTKSASPTVRTCADNQRSVRKAAQELARQGYDVRPLAKRIPDPTWPFLALFFASIKEETTLIENPAALDKRSRTLSRLSRLTPFWLRAWAQSHSEHLAHLTQALFDDCDVLLTPTTASRPGRVEDFQGVTAVGAMLKSTGSVAHTVLWNVTGHPAVAVPVGKDSAGLPLSVQVVGPIDGESLIMRAARDITKG